MLALFRNPLVALCRRLAGQLRYKYSKQQVICEMIYSMFQFKNSGDISAFLSKFCQTFRRSKNRKKLF